MDSLYATYVWEEKYTDRWGLPVCYLREGFKACLRGLKLGYRDAAKVKYKGGRGVVPPFKTLRGLNLYSVTDLRN